MSSAPWPQQGENRKGATCRVHHGLTVAGEVRAVPCGLSEAGAPEGGGKGDHRERGIRGGAVRAWRAACGRGAGTSCAGEMPALPVYPRRDPLDIAVGT